ncbi:hypothetical protein [Arthrobacter sp. M4]|uniref:hypothetical protein n=1 Tax=Arthrobacter sp. M4 TaxID=218160 RepID=UPI001CDCCC57|nr:hypothetical protein [Arthrobacter sp. M4]MCA4132786.1 hypothetical protein [Arthrobacter sp. M4]
MKPNAHPRTLGLALVAAAVVLAVPACSSGSPGPAGPAPASAASSTASSTGSASATASASPAPSATVGTLISGFPQKLIPVMPGATVVSSSFEKSGSPATVALVGTIKSPASAVISFYAQALEAQGFKAVPGDAVGSIASKDFLRGENETVNVSVVEVAGQSTFTVGANVAAESLK